jgi:D-lyxose ketol-isomerase
MMIVNEPSIAAHAAKIEKKTWGVEYWLVNTDLYCCKLLKIVPGYQSSIHAHAVKDETFIGLMGTTQLTIHDGKGHPYEVHAIHPGQQYRIRPETFHSFQAVNVAWIMEVSTRHSDKDVVRLQESRRLEP